MRSEVEAFSPIKQTQPAMPQALPARFSVCATSRKAPNPGNGIEESTHLHGLRILFFSLGDNLHQDRIDHFDGRPISLTAGQVAQLQQAHGQDGHKPQ